MQIIVKIGFVLLYLPLILAACAPAPTPQLTPQPTATAIPAVAIATRTPRPGPTVTSTPTLVGAGDLFSKISLSSANLHSTCDPQEVIFDVTVKSAKIKSVVFFYRIKHKATGLVNTWSNVAMRPVGADIFEYILRPSAIPGEARYWDGWVQYQFVGLDENLERVGQSQIFGTELAYTRRCP